MKFRFLVFLALSSVASVGQINKPLTHVEACRNFSDAVVQVTTDQMSGTGFIVSGDGWIITAFHVVADPDTLIAHDNLKIVVHGRKGPIRAEIVSPIDKVTRDRDFAILKIDRTQLPKLDLGNEGEIERGEGISIIGLPLSAMFRIQAQPIPKFCLTGTIAAQTALPLGNLEFLHTIYFQGVSIKGISGAPVISLKTGKVIGIVSTKLTGISIALADLQKEIASGLGKGAFVSGFEPGTEIDKIINVMDSQLANGLGSATGASDASNALEKAKHDYKRRSR